MMRAVALLPIVALVMAPVVLHPAPGSAIVAAVAAMLCAAGVLVRVPALVTAGASLTMIAYTVTLALTRAHTSVWGAIGLGVTLVLLLDASEFARRFHGANVSPRAWRRQGRHWLVDAAVGALAALAVASVATIVRLGAPPAVQSLLAAAGALTAVAGVAGAIWRRPSAADS